jgi:hypothetical protein
LGKAHGDLVDHLSNFRVTKTSFNLSEFMDTGKPKKANKEVKQEMWL